MPDGTVRGAFTLEAEQPIRDLKTIRDTAAEADAAMERLGARLEKFGRTRVSARVELAGFSTVNLQLTELEARLDRLDSRRATSRVGVSGAGGGSGFSGFTGGLGPGASSSANRTVFGSIGGFGGIAGLALGLSPGIQGLLGGAGALVGSAGAGALGAGAVGLGGLAPLAVGGALSFAAAKPAIAGLQQITQAQKAYTLAVQEFGRASSQAATDKRKLDAALANNPAAAGTARQLAGFQGAYRRAFAPAAAQFYRGASGVLSNATRALPGYGAAAANATGGLANAATSFSGFLGGSAQIATVQSLAGSFSRELPIAERSLENMVTTLGHLSIAAVPFFHEANVWVANWTAGLAKSSGDTIRVQGTMHTLVNSARDWARLTGAAGGLLKDIFAAGRPSGDSLVVQFTHTLDRWDAWIQRNPQKVTAFFQRAEQTTGKIASALVGVVRLISQLATILTPIFDRAMQFISFVSGAGPGGIGLGGAALLGGYQGLRGATGGKLPGAGSLASSFILGSAGPGVAGGGRVGGGSLLTGSAASASRAGAASYLMPRPGFQTGGLGAGELALAAGGGVLLRGGVTRDVLAARGRTAFEQAYPGGAFGGPVSQLGARETLLGRLGVGARGIAGGAARFALPVLGITALLQGAQTRGGAIDKIGGTVNSALHMASFGLLPSNSIQRLLGNENAGSSLGGPAAASVRALAAQAGNVRSATDLQQFRVAAHGALRVTAEMSPADRQHLQQIISQATSVAAANAGAGASNAWESAFSRGIASGRSPQKAVALMESGMTTQLRALGPAGSTTFAKDTAMWVSQMEADNPKLRKPLQGLMSNIVNDVNRMHHLTTSSMKDLRDKVFYFNGQIFTGTDATWGAIRDSMTNKATVAQEKLAGIWAQIQSEAINALTSMGFSRSQAQAVVTATTQGGQNAAAAQVSVGARQSGLPATTPLTTQPPAGTHLKKARGGMIGGSGLLDTVPTPDGSLAAPGEAWIANRHTMNALSSATLAMYGKTAWEMIRDEGRPHSAPARAGMKQGIMPGLQRGGRMALGGSIANAINSIGSSVGGAVSNTGGGPVGSLPQMIAEANAIASHNYPYLWGGGHNSGFTGPYDCSGAVSAVLHAGGALSSPEVSGWFENYGLPGPGPVTLYATAGHIYMSILDHFFGTSGSNPGGGANWFAGSARPGFVQRHIPVTGAAVPIGGPAGSGPAAMAMRQVSLRAPRSGLGGVPGAMADRASAIMASGMSQHVNDGTRWAGWHARGASAITNGPTLFGAGEGGRREKVTIGPMDSHTKGRAIQVIMQDVHLSAQPHEIEKIGHAVASKIIDALDQVGAGVTDAELAG